MKRTRPLYLVFMLLTGSVYAQKDNRNELATFATQTGAVTTIDKATGSVSYIKFPEQKAFKQSAGTTQDKALGFMQQNGNLFTAAPSKNNYQVKDSRKDAHGLEHVDLQQYVNGVPVFDGVVKFHFNKSKDLTALNGNIIRVEKLNTTPTISKEVANAVALKMVMSQKTAGFKPAPAAPLKAHKTTLYVFQKGLAQGYEGQKYLVYEVEVRNDADVREFLYIDAHSRELVEQFSGMHKALDRELYTYPAGSTSTTVPTLTWVEGNTFPGSLDIWQQSEIEAAGHMYHMMKNAFGFVSYDGADAKMITTHNNPNIRCPNANWNGVSANYCNGTASDDVVAHEWGHAYTEYTSGLIYAWQAGALNEAYSDIWGETVDLLNNYFDEGEGTAMRDPDGMDNPVPSTTTRWRQSEKASAFGGAIRDMYNPNNFNHPGRVLDPKYYCTTGVPTNANDLGGVHLNSGVINHSYALLVDGGNYNGQTISGIGLTKAAHIYWYAQANYMSKTTDFAAFADILEAAAQALIAANVDLPNLSTADALPTLSGQYITIADLVQLQKVLLAVEMRAENNCGYGPLLSPLASLCVAANSPLFSYDFESGLGSGSDEWTVISTPVEASLWFPRTWVLNSAAPGGRTGKVVSAVNYTGGDCSGTNYSQTGVMSLISPMITIPSDAPNDLSMAFDHYISLEPGWDGGNLRYKIGGGAWTLIPTSAFIANGYNQTLQGSSSGNSNPLAGQAAFSGADEGAVSGTWGESRINLTALGIAPGQSIQFRWDLGSDICGGWDGWYLDNVRIYSCATTSVEFVNTSTVVNEAEAIVPGTADCLPYVEKVIQVRINNTPSAPVTVTFNGTSNSATLGATADYSFTPASVVLQAGSLVQDVTLRIYNDAYVEGTETAVLSYILSGGDGFPENSNQTHTITINDNENVPGLDAIEVLYADFNDGYIPLGWTGLGSYPSNWGIVEGENPNDVFLDPNVPEGQPFLIANSDEFGVGLKTWSIETAPFNSVGMASINLSFLEVFAIYNGSDDAYDETATVEVWDGTTWHNLLTHTEASGNSGVFGNAKSQNIMIPVTYANAAMKLRFQYTANWDYYWALDNIKVTGLVPTQIATAVTTAPDEQYLGPLETAYFYDPASKNLIAKIENLTTHDYGCTTVEIDRAGTGSNEWVADYTVTNKTFKVTPSNPNPTGEYRITLYYSDAELGVYKDSIQSMGKSEAGITINNSRNGSFAEVQVVSAFNTDWAYTATFDSGFSGFGLSDAPPIGSLPVTLVNFEGKHNGEGNQLSWVTTTEVNSDYFAVERATNTKNFSEIGRVTSHENSVSTNNYNFTDRQYAKGLNYYRLKMVDKDGSHAYSKVISIDAPRVRESRLFPNPVQSYLNIELPNSDTKQVTVKVINVSGQVMIETTKVEANGGILKQDVSKLPTGVYRVVVSDEKSSYSFSVVKL